MRADDKLIGLVISGGKSKRMGRDKSAIVYFEKPHQYYLYEILETICCKVIISCNSTQINDIEKKYKTIVDLPCYKNIGPMAALLTAFTFYPENNFIVIGCDYPFISEKDIKKFLISIKDSKKAAAFYNIKENLYEPLLAYYSYKSANLLKKLFEEKNYSLQHFLETTDAEKYFPDDTNLIKSADNPEDYAAAKLLLNG